MSIVGLSLIKTSDDVGGYVNYGLPYDKVCLTKNNGNDLIYTNQTPPISLSLFKKNKQFIDNNNQILINSFIEFSKYSKDKANLETHLTYFLYAMQIVSTHEGSFGSINTYDGGGLSLGLIQLANPSGDSALVKYLGDLDSNLNTTLKKRVLDYFGKGNSTNRYTDSNSMKGRYDTILLTDLYKAITSDIGKKLQIKYAILNYYDVAYEKYLNIKSYIKTNKNKPDANTNNEGDLLVYINGFLFDLNVNYPVQFNKINTKTINDYIKKYSFMAYEGHFIYYFSNEVVDLATKQRDSDWNGVTPGSPLLNNFEMIG